MNAEELATLLQGAVQASDEEITSRGPVELLPFLGVCFEVGTPSDLFRVVIVPVDEDAEQEAYESAATAGV